MVWSRPFGPPVPWAPRLLLLAALLLGIVTMHTLGHPAGGHGGPAGAGGHEGPGTHAAAMHPAGAVHHGEAAAPAPVAAAVTELSAAPTELSAALTGSSAAADPDAPGGLDAMAVCLAVLAGWTVLLLLTGPLLRRSGDTAAEVRARLLGAVRAQPPPGGGRTLLTRLSVLRQ
ncbi:hypothetical protein ABZW03_03080 [Kitasatospora sp. NPDC004799]|uniref:hypothetical protein n=1 Tax=Kitasatospora sp. NPDC004799 TaxID=3154460 RepID=UPI0033B2BB79